MPKPTERLARMPAWVPMAARHYLAHTEAGRPIRALAREADLHASTVSRQVRRYETRREDPLVDAALRALALRVSVKHRNHQKEAAMTQIDPTFDETRLSKEALPVLRHLAEPGAILAIAEGMDLAVVVQDNAEGAPARRATVSRELAQAMALKEWIACDAPNHRVSRYRLTHQGRGCLRELVAARDNSASGFAEGQAQFLGASPAESRRAAISDSPLAALARRKDKDGNAFLDRDLVRAGERLREDFELSQIGPRVGQDWGHFLTAGVQLSAPGARSGGSAAKARLSAALAELGPGLGDVALRCCCQLEGLESAEKRMGWSARSGKIVLRIALQHLARHYARQGADAEMIG